LKSTKVHRGNLFCWWAMDSATRNTTIVRCPPSAKLRKPRSSGLSATMHGVKKKPSVICLYEIHIFCSKELRSESNLKAMENPLDGKRTPQSYLNSRGFHWQMTRDFSHSSLGSLIGLVPSVVIGIGNLFAAAGNSMGAGTALWAAVRSF